MLTKKGKRWVERIVRQGLANAEPVFLRTCFNGEAICIQRATLVLERHEEGLCITAQVDKSDLCHLPAPIETYETITVDVLLRPTGGKLTSWAGTKEDLVGSGNYYMADYQIWLDWPQV